MRCSLKLLICAVSLLWFSFPLSLEEAIKEELRRRFGDRVVLKGYRVLSPLPESPSGFELLLKENSPRGLFLVRNHRVGRVAVSVLWRCPVFVALRDIRPSERLTPRNTKREFLLLERCPRELGDIRNFVAKREIRKGETIRRQDLRRAFAVRRGETVRAVYRKGGLEITFRAKALDSGFVGGRVRVLSPFGKVLRGEVSGEGEVKILD
ncbi:MAG: flagellar basal body P-ring formation protein FlgA [Aquificae bacterium]|nr:flagellar basal body P-ring formation protein FlgA [Aquificota bacterium]